MIDGKNLQLYEIKEKTNAGAECSNVLVSVEVRPGPEKYFRNALYLTVNYYKK